MSDVLREKLTDANIREMWRKRLYPHIKSEVFEQHFADHTASGWDETRLEVAALTSILLEAVLLLAPPVHEPVPRSEP